MGLCCVLPNWTSRPRSQPGKSWSSPVRRPCSTHTVQKPAPSHCSRLPSVPAYLLTCRITLKVFKKAILSHNSGISSTFKGIYHQTLSPILTQLSNEVQCTLQNFYMNRQSVTDWKDKKQAFRHISKQPPEPAFEKTKVQLKVETQRPFPAISQCQESPQKLPMGTAKGRTRLFLVILLLKKCKWCTKGFLNSRSVDKQYTNQPSEQAKVRQLESKKFFFFPGVISTRSTQLRLLAYLIWGLTHL